MKVFSAQAVGAAALVLLVAATVAKVDAKGSTTCTHWSFEKRCFRVDFLPSSLHCEFRWLVILIFLYYWQLPEL